MEYENLEKTYQRIKSFVHCTPVLHSTQINRICQANLYFKCENFQKMGAFKMRGATNAILQLSEDQKQKGVVTHSSGNFAQALALAAKMQGIKAFIVMPENAPEVKVNAVKGYGGEIIISDSNPNAREKKADEIQKKTGATFIHPSNDLQVILGQGTAAFELLQEIPHLDIVITPVGGGGLIAGSSLAVHQYGKDCICLGAEPFEADDAYRSLKSGKIEYNETTNTIADGLRTNLGHINFPIIRQHVKEIIRVEEDEIVQAMRLIWERMKIVIEPSAAVPLAGIIRENKIFQGQNIGVIISGGNVDLERLPF